MAEWLGRPTCPVLTTNWSCLVCLLPVGFFNLVVFNLNYLFLKVNCLAPLAFGHKHRLRVNKGQKKCSWEPCVHVILKPWPNGVASRRKLKTWVYLRLHLARPHMHLRWLAMTCAHFGRDQICTQVDASFSPFSHPTQVNASCVTFIKLLLANEIQEKSALKCFFWRIACTCEETFLSFWPPNASLYSSSTCRYLRLLVSPFGQGLTIC